VAESSTGPESLPVVTLLYGDDHLALHDRTEGLAASMGDPSLADMNITRMDGSAQGVSLDAVRTAAFTLPFLTARRMLILTNPAGLLRSDAARSKFVEILGGLPETTALVLVQDDEWVSTDKQYHWKWIYEYTDKNRKSKIHPVLEWARANGGKVKIEVCRLPALNSMPGWIVAEARRQGGKINPQAAVAVTDVVGSDTGQARQEITKLLTYVDYQRPIEIEDVHELSAAGGQADVFTMVDALATGDGRLALRQLGRLLEEQDAPSLFGMVVRQFRLISMAREALETGVTSVDGVAKLLHVPGTPAGKALNQARLYDSASLRRIYHRLLEIDRASKTGKGELEVLLQAFVAEMSR